MKKFLSELAKSPGRVLIILVIAVALYKAWIYSGTASPRRVADGGGIWNVLPGNRSAKVFRTDFSDSVAWKQVCSDLQKPQGRDGFRANVECVSDQANASVPVRDMVSRLRGSDQTFAFLVDAETLKNPEHPVVVVDLADHPGQFFRVIPSQAWGVENNLSLSNMDFDDFAKAVDKDGVFRGFPEVEK